jgi:hypothetical protein
MLLNTQLEHLRRTIKPDVKQEPRQYLRVSIRPNTASITPQYLYEQALLDYKNVNRMTGGAINRNEETNRMFREHQKQLLNNRLNYISQVQGRRVLQGYYKPREEEKQEVFERIKQNYLRLIDYLKSNNYSKDIVSYPQKIENELLTNGAYISSNELEQIHNFNMTASELTLSDLVQDIFDYKDRNVYDTVRNNLKRLTKIIKTLKGFVNNTIEQRKQKLSAYKSNLEKSLLDKEKALEKQNKTEQEALQRLKYDDKFLRYKRLQQEVLEEERIRQQELLEEERKQAELELSMMSENEKESYYNNKQWEEEYRKLAEDEIILATNAYYTQQIAESNILTQELKQAVEDSDY